MDHRVLSDGDDNLSRNGLFSTTLPVSKGPLQIVSSGVQMEQPQKGC